MVEGVNVGSNDLDYVMQALSHRVRRVVVKALAERGSLTYSELMKEAGVEDSGTFGFHLRRMSRLVRKNERGGYELTSLGWTAYKVLKSLTPSKEAAVKRREEGGVSKPPERLVISDRAKFELNEVMAKHLLERGKRLFINDVLTVIIYPMGRELFDSVVGGISDCLTVYAPRELGDLVHERSSDVLTVKLYEGEPPRVPNDVGTAISRAVTGIVPRVLSSIGSTLSNILSGISPSRGLEAPSVKKGELLYSTPLPIKEECSLKVSASGGSITISEDSQGEIKVWSSGDSKPEVNVDVHEASASVEVNSGIAELTIPRGKVSSFDISMSGGTLKLGASMVESLSLDVDGGWVKISIASPKLMKARTTVNGGVSEVELDIANGFKGVANYEVELDGGISEVLISVPKYVCVKVESRGVEGGLVTLSIDGKKIPVLRGSNVLYVDKGFSESGSCMTLGLRLAGGVAKVSIQHR